MNEDDQKFYENRLERCRAFDQLEFRFVLQVSWIRRKDYYHLLTVGLTTYTGDERYQAIHAQHSEVNSLIKPKFYRVLCQSSATNDNLFYA
jgi:hypothetical protein